MADDFLQRGGRLIERVRSSSLSHAVGYLRLGSDTPIEVNATTDETPVEIIDEGTTGLVERNRDFLIAASELVDGVTPFKPAAGDVIQETIDGVTTLYEVRPLPNEPAWSFDDTLNLRVRIHTRRRGVLS